MNDAGSGPVLFGIAQAITLTMTIAFISYVGLIVLPYLRHRRAATADPERFDWHFLVPCRDEESVIGETLSYLGTHFPRAHVWVVDDDSDDATVQVVTRVMHARPQHVHLVRRHRPSARTGKGDALNAAYRAVKHWLGRHAHAASTILTVVDADGRPAPDCLAVCAGERVFGDPRVGAAQIEVRMLNRGTPAPQARGLRRMAGQLLVRMQDMEFRTAIAAMQTARGYTGTISMGGNGQFTRLAALDTIAGQYGQPWHGSLLEDFELGVHLLTAGWKTAFTTDTYVDQEGLYNGKRYLAQRTRWGQGTMQCVRYLRRIWESPHLSTAGAIEMSYYLLQPWMQLLGSLLYPVPLILLLANGAQFGQTRWDLLAVYAVAGVLPFAVWGPIYLRRCLHRRNPLLGLGYGVAYCGYIFAFYITSWRAFVRILRGRNGWAKTRRNTELGHTDAVALEQ